MFAAVFVFLYLYYRNKLPTVIGQLPKTLILLVCAALALVANYIGNVQSLAYVSPETVQVVMQVAPILLMIGGIVFFNERLNRLELLGAMILFVGLGLFFSPNVEQLLGTLNQYNIGIMVVIFAAVTWVGYALLQKVLLRFYSSKQLTLLIYCVGIVILLPAIDLTNIGELTRLQYWALLFCCLNTVVAYGCFTEALNVWSASKVSAVIATGPLFTFISMLVAQTYFPEHYSMLPLSLYVVVGACCVIFGSMLTALARKRAQVVVQKQ